MLKSLFVSAAGMLPKRRELEITANNLANLNTHGYKKDGVFYRHLLENLNGARNVVGTDASVLQDGDVYTSFAQGTLSRTGNALDVAIVGDGFFTVKVGDKQLVTRNGHFTIDNNGQLVDNNGNAVLTDGGELFVSGKNIEISESGQVTVDGEIVAQLKIVTFADLHGLAKAGENYFAPAADMEEIIIDSDHINLRQGFLENSNVDPMEEMVKMIELYRAFELAQKKIKAEDVNLQKINDMGRMR